MNKYVDVMIRTPLGVTGVFTYSVKEEDEDKVAVGKRAEVDSCADCEHPYQYSIIQH